MHGRHIIANNATRCKQASPYQRPKHPQIPRDSAWSREAMLPLVCKRAALFSHGRGGTARTINPSCRASCRGKAKPPWPQATHRAPTPVRAFADDEGDNRHFPHWPGLMHARLRHLKETHRSAAVASRLANTLGICVGVCRHTGPVDFEGITFGPTRGVTRKAPGRTTPAPTHAVGAQQLLIEEGTRAPNTRSTSAREAGDSQSPSAKTTTAEDALPTRASGGAGEARGRADRARARTPCARAAWRIVRRIGESLAIVRRIGGDERAAAARRLRMLSTHEEAPKWRKPRERVLATTARPHATQKEEREESPQQQLARTMRTEGPTGVLSIQAIPESAPRVCALNPPNEPHASKIQPRGPGSQRCVGASRHHRAGAHLSARAARRSQVLCMCSWGPMPTLGPTVRPPAVVGGEADIVGNCAHADPISSRQGAVEPHPSIMTQVRCLLCESMRRSNRRRANPSNLPGRHSCRKISVSTMTHSTHFLRALKCEITSPFPART